MRIPSPFRSYPPKWSTFDRYIVLAGSNTLGFAGSAADVNRFAARYRVAKCFYRVEFDELTHATADGYSELVHLLLTYSAFEHLLRCIGSRLQTSRSLLDDSERGRVLNNLRRLAGQDVLFSVLRQHLDPPYRRQVDAHLALQSCNPLYLAAGIRHAFAHGMFTATPGNTPQHAVATVCRFLCRVIFRIMDREFEGRMIEFEEEINQHN